MRSEVKEGAPINQSACATPHPYIPDRPDRPDIRKKKVYDKVNYERWHVISQVLPTLLLSQWIHTQESENCLDLILKDTTLKAFVANLRGHKFEQGYDQTGLFMSHLRKCAGVFKPTKGLTTREELDAGFKKLAEFDIDAAFEKLKTPIFLKSTFKLPD